MILVQQQVPWILLSKKKSYPQMFLKELKCIELKVIRHIYGNLSNFFFSDDDSDEE